MKFYREDGLHYFFWVPFLFITAIFVFFGLQSYEAHKIITAKDIEAICVLWGMCITPICGLLPILYQKIKVDSKRTRLYFWFLTIRNIPWSEVKQAGVAFTIGKGGHHYVIFVSTRLLTTEELNDLNKVKGKKDFVWIGFNNVVKDVIAGYSPVEFIDYTDYTDN